jgi:hypothetical protein
MQVWLVKAVVLVMVRTRTLARDCLQRPAQELFEAVCAAVLSHASQPRSRLLTFQDCFP